MKGSHWIHYPHSYTAFGLTIAAAFPIPELMIAPPSTNQPDIKISSGNIPAVSSKAKAVKKHAWTMGNQVWLKFDEVGSFWVNQGRQIVLHKEPGANDIECRFYILGAALACALVQRNILPLHGCSIVSGEKAVLFLGESGSGKSTLAARLQQLGYPILSDDISAVHTDLDQSPRLSIAYPQMKLEKTTLEFLDIAHDARLLEKNRRRKNFFPLFQTGLERSYPLDRIYILKRSSRAFIKDLAKIDCLPNLIKNTHRKAIVQSMCGIDKHFRQCTSVLNNVDAFYFSRPNDFTLFHKSVDMLTKHLAQK